MMTKKQGVLEEMMIEERFRLGQIRNKMEEPEFKDVHNYFRGYTDAVIYFEKLLTRTGRTDFTAFIRKYLP